MLFQSARSALRCALAGLRVALVLPFLNALHVCYRSTSKALCSSHTGFWVAPVLFSLHLARLPEEHKQAAMLVARRLL